MRVTELMIGDWVQTKVGMNEYFTPVQIDEIINEKTCGFEVIEKNGLARLISDIYPIPLTAEILEKNGFAQSRVGWIRKSYGAWDISVYLSQYAQIEIINYCGRGTDCEEVNYGSTIEFDHNISAHELQHSLRLCGLTELANNFKL